MKITFVLPPVNLSGGIRSTAVLARHLIKRGHEVSAICPAQPQPRFRQQMRSLLKGQELFSTPKRKPSEFDLVDVPLRVLDRYRPVRDDDIPDADVVVATWWETAEWVAKLSQSKGAKVYFIRHHEIHEYLPQERVAATYLLPLHKITISQWLIDVMLTQYGDPYVSLVPNAIDTQKYYAPSRNKQPVPTVGMMYSQKSWKGCDISLKAFSLAAEKIPNLHLVAFGSEEHSPDLPLPSGTEYIRQPPQDQIKELYAKCDAWLFGSRLEGFGRPILEAMACRTPVISTPAGAAPELLSDGGGILVKSEDPEDMAKAIIQICNFSDSEWQAMSDAAYAKATSYTWDNAAELCEVAFSKAIERCQRGDFSDLNFSRDVSQQRLST